MVRMIKQGKWLRVRRGIREMDAGFRFASRQRSRVVQADVFRIESFRM